MVESQTKLVGLILAVKDDEQRFGYAAKAHLLAVVEYIITNYVGYGYSKEEYTAAIILLAKYHMAPLADRVRGKRLIALERVKTYEARCCRCGAIISSKKSLETGLGIVCRKRLGLEGKKASGSRKDDLAVNEFLVREGGEEVGEA